jgi:RNA-binding protein MEX3
VKWQYFEVCPFFTPFLGCKIKALRAKTNTYIKTPARGEDPVFSISGRPDHVQSARWEITAAADHFSEIRASRHSSSTSSSPQGPSDKDKVTIYVRVPYRVVGLVVGPRGATVKRIQQLTHTFIVTPSRDKEPCFEVRGTPENVERARAEIKRYIVLRTGSKCSMEEDSDMHEDADLYVDQLTQQMQQCQVVDSSTFQYPTAPDLRATGKVFSGKNGLEIPYPKANSMEGSSQVSWNISPLPTIFTDMQFTPPDLSYQPMSAPLLSGEGAFHFGVRSQPLSPTGSYESNSSDGLVAISPNQSPLVPRPGTKFCCVCKSVEEMAMAALMPCGHNMFCETCAHYIACSSGSCPLCNAQVTNVMHCT